MEERKKEKDGKNKGKGKQVRKCSTKQADQTRARCYECEMYYDKDEEEGRWIECEQCFNWYHAACVGIEFEEEEIADFVCHLYLILFNKFDCL